MAGSVGGPRILLRRLREVMAEPESAQKRLDKIVVLIAAAVGGVKAGRWLRLPAAIIVGPMLASAAAHIAGLTAECGERMAIASIQNAIDYLDGTLDRGLIVNAAFAHA